MRKTEMFDARFFSVSPAEASAMDPQQRLLLERGYEALAESGLKKGDLDGNGTGVFIGIQALDFQEILRASPAGQGVFAATGCNLAVSSGRVSYCLGMQGPCASYDTACSAGLVAAEAGLRSLQLGGCPSAMASGVNLMLVPATSVGNGVAGMTSPNGRCHTFDSRADGYARGDACCTIAMHARKGVSRLQFIGCAVRQDGRSASLTAPNGIAQEEVFMAAHDNAGITADDLITLEAHGTGTALGDPIESRSLLAVVLTDRDPDNMVNLSSVKANIGHAEPGAGLSGMSKLLLSMHHQMCPINAQLRVMNTHVRAAVLGAPCALPTQTAGFEQRSTFAAGVSSFGYSGTIVHANTKLLTDIYHPPQKRVKYNRVAFRWSGFETRDPTTDDDCDAGLYHYTWEPKDAAGPSDTPISRELKWLLLQLFREGTTAKAISSAMNKVTTSVFKPWVAEENPMIAPVTAGLHTIAFMFDSSYKLAPSLWGVQLLLDTVQTVLKNPGDMPRLVFLTTGTYSFQFAANIDTPLNLGAAHGGVWGFSRVLRMEKPKLKTSLSRWTQRAFRPLPIL